MKRLVLFLLVVGTYPTYAVVENDKYQWETERQRYSLSETENSYSEYILKDHHQFDYELLEGEFVMFETIHKIIKVNNNDAIQRNNRIFVSMRNVIDLVELKARSINPDGKVVNFDKNNLKEIKDEESGNGYRIFAIEGAEQGSEIEFYYTLKKSGSIYDRVYLQYETPVKKSSFQLSCPKHLVFDIKGYGGKFEVVDEYEDDLNIYSLEQEDIIGLKKENFASFNANRKRIDFKLAYNTAKSKARLYTWDEAAKRFYSVLITRTKDDDKALDKFVKQLGDKPEEPLEKRIKNIESKIKLAIQINPDLRADDLASILKQKLASNEGITKLFVGVFDRLGITYEPVITCDRSSIKFDKEFDTWGYLHDYLLYFPTTKGYLAPYNFETRYPVIPPEFTAQDGLFIEPFEVGTVRSALGSVKTIPALSYTLNTDNLDIRVEFNEDLSKNNIEMRREFGGINSTFILPYFHLMNEEQKYKMVEELLKSTAPDPVIEKWDIKPVHDGPVDKVIIENKFTSSHFIETAGSRILFKVGELIGPQTEMYREDNRMNSIENDYNRGYDRIIEIKLPKGYKVRNLDDLNSKVIYKDGEEIPYSFESTYTITDNTLKIVITEYYKEIYAPLSRYEDYRNVINAAADFNKITLVLEKE